MDTAAQALIERAQSDRPIVWNFLGDSITHGALHTWGRRDYVELFDERVRWQLRRQHDVIINTAYSGYTVPDVLAELELRCLRFRPDVVCIMLGMNDASRNDLAAFERGYLALVEEIRARTGALILLQTPNLIDFPNAQARIALPEYAGAIRRVAAAANVPLCDHYAVWEAYAAQIGNCLTAQGVFPAELGPNYDEFTRLLRALLLISTQETLTPEEQNANVEKPTADDRQRAADIGGTLRRVETLSPAMRAAITGEEDAMVPIIADVFTDPNSGRVLEVAVGQVLTVVVPVPDAEQPVEAYGPIFSYYEFPQPVTDRLTDAVWQQQLEGGKAPALFVLGPWVK